MEENNHIAGLAAAIKAVRKEEQISVVDLAKKMGCSPSYIRMVESGSQGMSFKKLGDFADALGRELVITFPKKKIDFH